MEKYMNQELKDVIKSVQVKQGTAKDSGNLYFYLEIVFCNGYSSRIMCFGDKQFAIQNALETYETSKQIDATF